MKRRAWHVGRTREKLAVLLAAAFEAAGEQVRVDPARLTPAQGRWRSDFRMDVMRWEGIVQLFRHGKWDDAQVGSWSTMTDCARFGLLIRETDIYGIYEVDALDDLQSYRARARARARDSRSKPVRAETGTGSVEDESGGSRREIAQ